MYRIESGSTHGLRDTERFIAMLNDAGESSGARALFDADESTDAQKLFKADEFFDADGGLFVARAPGRLDLMGGIADYSGSLVLQLPIASAAHVAVQLRDEPTLEVVSLPASREGEARRFELPLADIFAGGRAVGYAEAAEVFKREGGRRWAAYVLGAFVVLARERGAAFDRGARLLVRSEVPEGKGVSSSAALEVATMRAVAAAYGIEVGARELALLCQRVENLVACAPCGVMDQMTAACGEAGRLLELLCQPAELKGTVALPEELEVWGVDSGVRHSVGGSDYGAVRTAAFMGYRLVAEAAGLRVVGGEREGHVSIEDSRWRGYLANVPAEEFGELYERRLPERMSGAEFLERYGGITDEVTAVEASSSYPVRDATRHPVYEHARVRRFAEVLKDWRGLGQAEELGALMYASHESYSACGLGSEGTDALVSLVRGAGAGAGLYGAKITGGGSGGTVAVLGRRGAGESVRRVAEEYARRTNHRPLVVSGSSPGAARFGVLRLARGGPGR